ncbi:DUF3108 domain-containing protein [bacterium]|nr:DUF3108 domain-containing protein [candidate division CSSED10-310 bacterium]
MNRYAHSAMNLACRLACRIPSWLAVGGWLVVGMTSTLYCADAILPAFEVGEKLVYDVSWLGITAGQAKLRVTDIRTLGGKQAYRVKVTAETSKGFSVFFKLRDELTSTFTTDLFHSLRYTKRLREGKYHADDEIIYNHEAGFAVYRGKQFEIPFGVRDPISCIYYLRSLDLEKLTEIHLRATSDNKNHDIIVKIQGVDPIKIGGQMVDALLIEPVPAFESRLFQKDRSELRLWLSRDERKVPLRIMVKIKIGAITAELTDKEE